MLLLRPGVLRGAALFSPMVPIVPDVPPSLQGIDVFISAGRRDPLVPAENTQRLADLLEQYGASVSLRWTNGGHTLTPEDAEAAAHWLSAQRV